MSDEKILHDSIVSLLNLAPYCSLATVSAEGIPMSAAMLFARGANLSLYFYTLNDTRKYANLQTNSNAGVSMYHNGEYAQIEGLMTELVGHHAQEAKEALIARDGGEIGFHNDSRCKYFRFEPKTALVRTGKKPHYKHVSCNINQARRIELITTK